MHLKSAVAGRQRWETTRLAGQPRLAAAVESALGDVVGVSRVSASALTGKVLVRYDPQRLSPVAVEHAVAAALELPPVSEEDLAAWQRRRRRRRSNPRQRLQTARRRLGGVGALLVATVLKRLVFGKGAFGRSLPLLEASSTATVILGYPIFRSMLRSIAEPQAEIAVRNAAIGLLAMRGSIEGLTVLSLVELGKYLEATALEQWQRQGGTRSELPATGPSDDDAAAASLSATASPVFLALSAAIYLLTGNRQRALFAAVLACPAASLESRTVARSAAMNLAARKGLPPPDGTDKERDIEDWRQLEGRRAEIDSQNEILTLTTGGAGAAWAVLGHVNPFTASLFHNVVKSAALLNSARLAVEDDALAERRSRPASPEVPEVS